MFILVFILIFILVFILVIGFLTVIVVVVSASALVYWYRYYVVDGLGTSDATRLWQLEAR